MAYVEPHGTIELYQNVPLTPSYEHTLWFESPVAQRAYFAGKNPRAFYNQMYTRVHGNKVRIHVKADDIARYNYLGFTNDFGAGNASKWYYAFIDKIEYINEQVTEVTYILDDIQTWFMSMTFGQCFIERQHSTSDEIGDNLQPEPVQCYEHIAVDRIGGSTINQFKNVGYILSLGSVTKPAGTTANAFYTQATYNGFASTIKYLYFDTPTKLINFLNAAEFVDGAIKGLANTNDLWTPLSLYVVPTGMFDLSGQTAHLIGGIGDVTLLSENVSVSGITVEMTEEHGDYNNRYSPKNKKLLTYPYTYITVETPLSKQDFKFETFFSAWGIKFKWYATCNPSPAFIILPEQYNQSDNDYQYSIVIDNFPSLPVYTSGWYDAAGQEVASKLKNAIMVGISTLTSMMTSPEITSAGTTALTVENRTDWTNNPSLKPIIKDDNSANFMKRFGEAETALYSKGLQGGGKDIPIVGTYQGLHGCGGVTNLAPVIVPKGLPGGFFTDTIFTIDILQMGLRTEFAKRIDEFFSKYGYAQNKVATPNIHARTRYTYVKTRGCCAKGAVPAEAIRTMNSVMDSGITWWVDTNVGYYTDQNGNLLDNPIRS